MIKWGYVSYCPLMAANLMAPIMRVRRAVSRDTNALCCRRTHGAKAKPHRSSLKATEASFFFYSCGWVNYGAVDENHGAGACRYNGTTVNWLDWIESIWTQLLAAYCVPSTLKPSGCNSFAHNLFCHVVGLEAESDLCFCAVVVIRHLGRLHVRLAVLRRRQLQPGLAGGGGADLGQVVSLLDALPPEHVVQAPHQEYSGKDAAADSSPSECQMEELRQGKLLNSTTGSSVTGQDVHTYYQPS